MKRILIILFIFLSFLISFSEIRIKVDKENFEILKKNLKSLDIVGFEKGKSYLINLPEKDFEILKGLNLKYEIYEPKSYKTDYKSLAGYYQYIDSLVLRFPNIVKLETLDFTYNGNPLVIMKINGENPSAYSGQNTFLLMALHHSREWQTTVTAIFFAESLLFSYGKDSLITSLIDKNFIIVFPIVNPDGYYYSHDDPSGDNYWRKNRSYRNGYYGVDLNRNYGGGCNKIAESEWGYIAGISHNPSDLYTYCGPYPSSEVEVRSVENLIKNYNVKLSLSLHSYGEDILYPWASVYNLTLDEDIIRSFAFRIASKMKKNSGEPYDTLRSVALYATTGDTDDWIYGFSKFVKGKTTIPFTVEMDQTFQPPVSTLDTLCRNVFSGFLEGLILTDSVEGRTEEIPLKPEVSIFLDSLFWKVENKEFSDFYRVKIYSGKIELIDSSNEKNIYNIININLDSSVYYSPKYSFHPINLNSSFSVLESKYKSKYFKGDTLYLTLKYDLEKDYDVLLVEYSTDGFEYKPVDTNFYKFTGTNLNWNIFKIPFNEDSNYIFLRIRTLFDPFTLNSGVWIDDIGYLTKFTSDTIFKDSVVDTSMLIEIPSVVQTDKNFFEVTPYKKDFGFTKSSDYVEYFFPLSLPPVYLDSLKFSDYNIEFDFKGKTLILTSIFQQRKDIQLKIYDLSGKQIYSEKFSFERKKNIGLSFLKSGKYFLILNGNDKKRYSVLIIK
uniref:carboxypeptidase T n=1 Tax=candidate division WOR-3 bacterium TaxID=2052148 RepID=A0A7C3J731_UNCW3